MRSVTPVPIHVLEVIGNAKVGGVENHVLSLVQHLPAFGIRVTCLAPYESAYTAKLRSLGADVFLTEMHVNVPWRSLQFLNELIIQQEIDVIHSHLPRAHLLSGLAAHLTQRPAVATIHGMELGLEEFSIIKMAGMHTVAVCQQAYSQTLFLGMPPKMVHLIPNGVDLDRFCPRPAETSFRQEHRIPPDALLAGFAGRFSWEKGPDQLIQMAKIVHQTRPEVHFAMVGDGPMLDELRAMVPPAGLDEVFHIAGFSESMETIYPAFDLFAMTSRIEGMPLAALEAMACGIPVVAMSVGGLSEAIEVGTTGLTSAAEDVKGLANALLILAQDAAGRKKMGEAARQRAVNLYGLQQAVSGVAELLRSLTKYSLPSSLLDPDLVMPKTAEVKAHEKTAHVKVTGRPASPL
jgi:glycosyltransferase involved in cell wall biosynthesis